MSFLFWGLIYAKGLKMCTELLQYMSKDIMLKKYHGKSEVTLMNT